MSAEGTHSEASSDRPAAKTWSRPRGSASFFAVRTSSLALILLSILLMAQAHPWRRRRRVGMRPNYILTDRVETESWPDEPPSPTSVDPTRFAEALRTLCGFMPPSRATRWAEWMIRYGAEFEIDPFLIAALVYRESRCIPETEPQDDPPGYGLTRIPHQMYQGAITRGQIRYHVATEGEWAERSIRVDRFPFGAPRLLMSEPNIYFAAGLLAMWRAQHDAVDEAFEQAPHRHWVSHFVWGDRVRSDWEEEHILTDRRRVLVYYGALEPAAPVEWNGYQLGCPLDGCPRVVLSWLGADREDGARSHRGTDIDALPGEPVRAIADGVVTFAGVDLPGHQSHVQIRRAAEYEQYSRRSLGAGGRYVCILHGGDSNLRSCSMHLETVEVVSGQSVQRGALLGTVGRTGMVRSAAHLHLEIHTARVEDASAVLAGLLLGQRPE